MNKQTTARGAAVAVAVLSLALAGCGSDTKTDTSSSAEETSTSAAAAPETTPSDDNLTIPQYIKENGIKAEPVKVGEPGVPSVKLPMPPGWADAGPNKPSWALSQIVFTDPSMPPPPPTITSVMNKLIGDVEGAKILEYAPNELKNLPDYNGGNDGQPGKFGGFDAVQVAGTYVKDGKTLLVAQKTTVIPADDGLFVLQINAEGTEEQMGPLMDATAAIDQATTILPAS